MIGVAIGCATRARTIQFVNTFAAFLSRGFDHIRMGAVSQTDCSFVGSHVGVSIGEDGPSQMALEDMAMFRAVPGSTVFYPTDAVSTERAVELAANTKGICFRRMSRPNTPVIYDNEPEMADLGGAELVSVSADRSMRLWAESDEILSRESEPEAELDRKREVEDMVREQVAVAGTPSASNTNFDEEDPVDRRADVTLQAIVSVDDVTIKGM